MKILSMSGFVPEHVCDTIRFNQYTGDRNIAHFCGYASDFLSMVLKDESIDGAVYPKSCDSTRIMTSYLSESGKFLFQIGLTSYGSAGAVDYLAGEIERYKSSIEAFYGISINNIRERSELINERNKRIKDAYSDIGGMSYAKYLKEIHRLLEHPLKEQKWTFTGGSKPSEKKVFLVGSFLSNLNVVEVIEKTGLTVVGDTLPESGRLASRKSVNISGDIYKEIAESILSTRLSPTQNMFELIIKQDFDEITQKGAKGIIFLSQKYCEPYDFLYSLYKKEAENRGIQIIQFSMNNSQDDGKADLLMEAFADTIR